jgi:hypothetical protein
VNTKVAVVRGAIKAKIDAKGDGGPSWVLLTTVKADLCRKEISATTPTAITVPGSAKTYLIRLLRLQLVEDLQRLLLSREAAHVGQ